MALVGDQLGRWRQCLGAALRDLAIVDVTWCQKQDEGTALLVADIVEFGVAAALGAADTMGRAPFFATGAAVDSDARTVDEHSIFKATDRETEVERPNRRESLMYIALFAKEPPPPSKYIRSDWTTCFEKPVDRDHLIQ